MSMLAKPTSAHPKVVPRQEWEGNVWFWSQPFGEYPIQTDLIWSDGSSVGVNIVLACTACNRRSSLLAPSCSGHAMEACARALLLTLPLIHVLNIFRTPESFGYAIHGTVDVFGVHVRICPTYAARIVALLAMYGLALVMFRLLPELHAHVLRLMRPINWPSTERHVTAQGLVRSTPLKRLTRQSIVERGWKVRHAGDVQWWFCRIIEG